MADVTMAALPRLQERRGAGSQRDLVMRRLRANRLAIAGSMIVSGLILIALFAPLLAPRDPIGMSLEDQFMPPSAAYPMGTDEFGRDILSRMVHGSRISLQVGLVAVGIAAIVGSVVGSLAGYFGGWFDLLSGWAVDVMLAFPGLLLALGVVAILGPGLINVMIAVGIGSIPTYARLMRGQVLGLKRRDYVEAARAVGASHGSILFRHILPNAVSPLIVLASLGIGGSILAAAALSFIGLGAQPPSPEWGAMLSSGREYLRHEWWITTFPGVAIAVTVLGFNLLGDGLRDALDPQSSIR